MNCCSSCGLPYDVARRRRIVDQCGHERCFTCVNGDEPCLLCDTKGSFNANHFASFGSNWPSRSNGGSFRHPSDYGSRKRFVPMTNGHLTMTSSSQGMDLLKLRQQPASTPATPRLVRSSKVRPRPEYVDDDVDEQRSVGRPSPHQLRHQAPQSTTPSSSSRHRINVDANVSYEQFRRTNIDIDQDIYSNHLNLSSEAKSEVDEFDDDDDETPPSPDFAQRMLSERLNNLLIPTPRRNTNIDVGYSLHNIRQGSRCNSNNSGFYHSPASSDVDSSRNSRPSTVRCYRQSQESIISLMSSSSTSGLGSPMSGPHHRASRQRRFNIGTSSADSSRSSLNDGSSSGAVGSSRKQIYRRSARNLSIQPELMSSRSGQSRLANVATAVELPFKPMPFEVPSVDVDSAFVGREWLFHELYEILVKPNCDNGMRGAVVFGGVGSGKTAAAHVLACASPFHNSASNSDYVNINVGGAGGHRSSAACSLSTDSGFVSSSRGSSVFNGHYVSSNSNLAAGSPDFRQLVADALAAYHFCQIESHVTCSLTDFLLNLAATVAYNPYFFAYRDFLANRPDLLEYFTCDVEACKDPSRAFRTIFTDPLLELRKCNKLSIDHNFLIVVDGLDEAEYHRAECGDSVGSFLVKYAEALLPPFFKLVLTTKTGMLDALKGLRLHKINLDNTVLDERVFKDAANYARMRINDDTAGAIRRNVNCGNSASSTNVSNAAAKMQDCPAARFADHLTSTARGNFLYMKLTLNLIERNHLVMKGANYKALPVNIGEVFLLMFNLKFPTPRSFERVASIFNVVLASSYPLTAKEIFDAVNAAFVDTYLSWEEFCERLLSLQEYLVQRQDDTYVFFHPAFRDWLIRREDGQSPKFLCDLRHGHALLALRLHRSSAFGTLDAEKMQELGHHMLKAHLYKSQAFPQDMGLSGKDCQLHWLMLRSNDIKNSLCTNKNVFSPNTKVSRLLLLAGADPNAKTSCYDQAPLLCVAARHGRNEFVALLLEFGADVGLCDAQGLSPLMHAAIGGNLDAAQLLHQHGAKLSQVDNRQRCALVHAAAAGHSNVVSFFLQCDWTEACRRSSEPEHHRDMDAVAKQQATQQAFVAAADAGVTAVCQFLLDFGDAAINEPDPITGETALSVACLHGRKETAAFLLNNEARVSYGCSGRPRPPLIQAVSGGCWEIVSALLAKGASVDGERNENGETPLIVAAQNGHIGVLELLLSRDANINLTDKRSRNALCWACIKNRASCAGLLLERGCKLDSFDESGRAPYHYAAEFGDKQLVQLILDAATVTEIPDGAGLRPLEIAIRADNVEGVRKFLRKGAKLSPVTWTTAENKPPILLVLFQKLLDDGHLLYKKGRLEDAVHRFEYALKKLNVDDGEDFSRLKYHLLLNLARCQRKLGRRRSAVEVCTEAILCEPMETEAYFSRARLLYEMEKYEAARADLMRILKAKPSSKEAVELLSKIADKLKCTASRSVSTSVLMAPSGQTPSPSDAATRSWEQGSSDSGNMPDMDIAEKSSPSKGRIVSGKSEENAFESEL